MIHYNVEHKILVLCKEKGGIDGVGRRVDEKDY
jgi:hypothetical protein